MVIWSPNQNQDNVDTSTKYWELTLDTGNSNNRFLVVLLVDFDSNVSAWYYKDKAIYVRSKIYTITSQYDLENSSSCTGLI